MTDARLMLFYLVSFAGFIMVVGGMYLLYKQKIYIDKESNQPIEIQLPGNLSFKSNYPALALFVLGFIPLIWPFHELKQLVQYPHVVHVDVTGIPKTSVYPTLVYASIPTTDAITEDGQPFHVNVPIIGDKDQDYKVLLVANGYVLDTETVSGHGPDDIKVQFKPAVLTPPPFQLAAGPVPRGYK